MVVALVSLAGLVEPRADGFARTLDEVQGTRQRLAATYDAVGTDGKVAIRDRARRYVVAAIVERIVPAWLGTPWTMARVDDGLRPDASRPDRPGSAVSCSWFVVGVLRNAGLRLDSARRFAGALARDLQRSLTASRREHHRYWNLSPAELEQRLVALGDGLYLIGLARHVGFVHVSDGRAEIIHSSPDAARSVVRERVSTSAAIAVSAGAGYLVTPLFEDDRLIEHWLTGRPVPFRRR